MITIEREIDVAATAAAVFAAVVDLRGYDRWLPGSGAYAGTAEISDGPVALGTTYVEPSASGVRRGTVTAFEAPRLVTFHQPMTMRPALLGTIDITVRYTFDGDSPVRVRRVVTAALPVPLKLARPVVAARFRAEIDRTLHALKAFVER